MTFFYFYFFFNVFSNCNICLSVFLTVLLTKFGYLPHTSCLSLFSWYTLDSRPGKKRKDRGKIQVSIQFVRNNMTASMFDLSMRDKPRSPFSKLKEKMKGRKHDGAFSDTSSAILPRSGQSEADSLPDQHPHPQAAPEPKPKRSLLTGTQKLSAAHSMSDLIGTHFRPKLDSVNSVEEKSKDILYMVCSGCSKKKKKS